MPSSKSSKITLFLFLSFLIAFLASFQVIKFAHSNDVNSDLLPTPNEQIDLEDAPTPSKPLPPEYRFTADPIWDNRECNQNSFRAAFITFDADYIRYHEKYELENYNYPSQSQLNAITKAKDELPYFFNYATEGLAQLDTSYEVVTLPLKPSYIYVEGESPDYPYKIRTNVVAKDFYQQHPDEFDFLFFVPPDKFGSGYSRRISMLIRGLGLREDVVGSYVFDHGSQGQLKQVAVMNINEFTADLGIYSVEQTALHEMGHQFSALFTEELTQVLGVNFHASNSHSNGAIATGPIEEDQELDTYDVMHSYGRWEKVNSNWFHKLGVTEGLDQAISYSKFSHFDLYFWGLLPQERWDDEVPYFDVNHQNYPHSNLPVEGYLTVYDVIDILGERECVDPGYGEGNVDF